MSSSNTAGILTELLLKTDKVCFIYDVDAQELRYLNQVYDALWKRSAESLKKDPAAILHTVHPNDRELILQKYTELLNGIILKEVEFHILQPDQSVKWLQLSPHLITDEQGRKCIAGIA